MSNTTKLTYELTNTYNRLTIGYHYAEAGTPPMYYVLLDTDGNLIKAKSGFNNLETIRKELPSEFQALKLEQFLSIDD